MKVNKLLKILKNLPDDTEVFYWNDYECTKIQLTNEDVIVVSKDDENPFVVIGGYDD